ncbi:enoyl-CoA hydratase/isomerase family protein [Rhodoplanes sp. TEM]|uniref:Enoyl-CoA hydratase/isomerase family protein n=1 Tax=Rhodoplanes tepidamans TaxID=200616 RepID=A0ABT5J347_RHOTP|nr:MULTISPECIES: enoyl-CoA hydratase/isomerase family protein [Rhodoplanes]MDC7784106.1 enoyl-CoA hydratase/isomerase family protein [Rhodoplanes tepidamans]MDC7983201.1 enoyl-CoA hydratase/isomerase family protein [Rhodoplanes sp. TEM]MDQ0356797.1 enoyl-CoA hydratase/carnithine racemase [Rhodoplanes tepidamans]
MPDLLTETHGAVRVITLNRPAKRNALDNALTTALLEALRDADAAAEIGAVVLTGAGPAFCAGADLSEFKMLTPENQHLVDRRAELTMSLHGIFPKMTKPVITAVNGPAMGGGAGLALAGDVAVMAESATLGWPEVKHGIVAAIVLPSLVRNIGRKAAFELVATGAPMDAKRAQALGAVNHVVPSDELMDVALALAGQMASFSRAAMAATKQLFYHALDVPYDDALVAGREANRRMRAFRKG